MSDKKSTSFEDLNLSKPLLKAVGELGYEKPYPIQKEAIPAILAGKDILGIAQTGSGKTASFVLPILSAWRAARFLKNRHIKVLVLVPTRELAVQVGEVFQTFSQALPHPVKSLAVFGGVSINPQMIALQGVFILVATPGRLLELVSSKAVHLGSVETLVLDEADKMLNLGFQKEVDEILALLPKTRQNLLFSATLSEEVLEMNRLLLQDPVVVKIGEEVQNLDQIAQAAYAVPEPRKGPLLRCLLKQGDWPQVLVFTSTIYKADNVANKLRKNGIEAAAIHGKKSQGARTDALQRFKAGKVRVLVATDLLSRGIDIQFLPLVVNYDLPRSPKDFIHRIGRTGRAEAPGQAITFVSPEAEHHWRVIQKKMKKRVETAETEEMDLHGF